MTPLHQTKFGTPEGNCIAACVASIMEKPLSEVPNFIMPKFEEWQDRLDEWLAQFGLSSVCVSSEAMPGAYSIACGVSPRDKSIDHCVVWRGGAMIHDPHPSGDGIVGEPHDWTYFVLIDAAQAISRL